MGRLFLLVMSLIAVANAQTPTPSAASPFVSVLASVLVLNHVRVIDGTGAAAKENQSVVIADGKIQAVGTFGTVAAPANAEQLDRTEYTVIPGLVGMHDHLYYTDSTPSLKTVSTFSMSSIFFDGSPLMSTRSACLPGAIEPILVLLAEVGCAIQGGVSMSTRDSTEFPPGRARPIVQLSHLGCHPERACPGLGQASRRTPILPTLSMLPSSPW